MGQFSNSFDKHTSLLLLAMCQNG